MSRKVKLDMTGVESYSRCPEGEWLAKLKKIEETTVQSGDDALKAQFEVIKGEAKGNTVFETFSLAEKALWKFKSFLSAAGVKADGKIVIDLDKLEGKTCVISVSHEEYNGSKRAKISSFEKPVAEKDDDEDEDLDDEDLDDEEDEEEEEPPKKTSKKAAPAKTKKSVKKPEPEEDEDDEDEEEEDEPAPAKKSTKKADKKPAKATKKKPEPEDEDDDDDWEEDDD